jgi:hypothetical protein
MRQAFADRVDEPGARKVEVFGNELVQKLGIFSGENGAEPDKGGPSRLSLRHKKSREDESFDHFFELGRLALGACRLKKPESFAVERVAVAPVDLGQQPLFAAEIVAEQGPVNARGRRNGPHGNPLIPLLRKKSFASGDQLFASLILCIPFGNRHKL